MFNLNISKMAVNFFFLFTLLLFGISSYGSSTQIGRYLQVENLPLKAQADLLTQTREITFPDSVKSTNDAINHLLLFSGYSLSRSVINDDSASSVLRTPLPEVDRNFGPIDLLDGLSVLVGKEFIVLVDPIHRQISFKLRKEYQNLYFNSSENRNTTDNQ